MLVSDDLALVRYGHDNAGILIEDDALTSQTAFETRADRAINEIFFFVGNFFQVFIAGFDVDMAG